jgi:FlaA1/EpsC-like NDP-sugar epimerase
VGFRKGITSTQEDGVHRDRPHEDENIVEELILVPLLGSVCDEDRIRNVFETWRPETVYHAAAYKHVPIVEHNPIEGFRNNVNGTRVCAEAALKFGASRFVLVSTDKAVRPTNIMGATKRLAEMVLQGLANDILKNGLDHSTVTVKRTVFSMVRFGNVLGSSGSVVPMFREQVRGGGPVTVTHPEMTRYFMSIPEAAQLVIQAGAMGTGGDVFVLDMGEPVKILDLARRIVELSGLEVCDASNPNGDIEIKVTGLRPGEKLYEELLISDNSLHTQHPRIKKANEPYLKWPELVEELQLLNKLASQGDVAIMIKRLQKLVVGYSPTGEVMDWIYREKRRTFISKGESDVSGSL